MMNKILIKGAKIVNEGEIYPGDVFIEDEIIKNIYRGNIPSDIVTGATVINAGNNLLIPGVIDDQVHFREPGLTHKGDIYTETKAAVAGGVTSFMDMPNTQPNTLTQ